MKTKTYVKQLLQSEFLQAAFFAVVCMAIVLGAVTLWSNHCAVVAREQAQTLVGEQTIVSGKWFWIGYVELKLEDGRTFDVPVNTVYGRKFASYCINVRRDLPIRVKVSYHADAENTTTDLRTKTEMPGAYLSFTELEPAETQAAMSELGSTVNLSQ